MQPSFSRGPLTSAERRATLIARPWRADERRVVATGMWGRFFVAIEPAVLAGLFALVATYLLRQPDHLAIAAVMAVGAAGSLLYAVCLMLGPLRSLLATFGRIYIVDGYVRTRPRDDLSERGENGYVAVLQHDERLCHEWATRGEGDLVRDQWPALVEFSEYGGIHAVDGKATGVLPKDFPALGIGVGAAMARRRK